MIRPRPRLRAALVGALALVLLLPTAAFAQTDDATQRYVVAITNASTGQPFSPPVVATHSTDADVFEVGAPSSDAVAAIAQSGDPAPLSDALSGLDAVTDAVNVARPLPPSTAIGGFAPVAVATLEGRPGDVLSVVGMLICTNDGFFGVDGLALPGDGPLDRALGDYDAGREENTEVSEDLVDPCSGLGPVMLPGDPDGNVDDGAVATDDVIAAHPNIAGTGELTVADHGWDDAFGGLLVAVRSNAFADDDGTTHAGAIDTLAAIGVIRGFDDGTYGPARSVTRGQMASLLVRALALPPSGVDAFADDDGSTHEDAIDALAAAGITNGRTTDRYVPGDEVSRGELASFLQRALDLPPSDVDAFADDDGTTHEDAIDALAASGITEGRNDAEYDPDGDVTRGQIASFLLRALGPAG